LIDHSLVITIIIDGIAGAHGGTASTTITGLFFDVEFVLGCLLASRKDQQETQAKEDYECKDYIFVHAGLNWGS